MSDDDLPCDVLLKPNTIIRKGCKVSVLLLAIERRRRESSRVLLRCECGQPNFIEGDAPFNPTKYPEQRGTPWTCSKCGAALGLGNVIKEAPQGEEKGNG